MGLVILAVMLAVTDLATGALAGDPSLLDVLLVALPPLFLGGMGLVMLRRTSASERESLTVGPDGIVDATHLLRGTVSLSWSDIPKVRSGFLDSLRIEPRDPEVLIAQLGAIRRTAVRVARALGVRPSLRVNLRALKSGEREVAKVVRERIETSVGPRWEIEG